MDVWQDDKYIICPYCGVQHEPFDIGEDESGPYECIVCGKIFNLEVSVVKTYTSTMLGE